MRTSVALILKDLSELESVEEKKKISEEGRRFWYYPETGTLHIFTKCQVVTSRR